MASTPVGSDARILEVLNRNNYIDWRPRMKTYLLAEDLWEVVEAIAEPAEVEDDEGEYKAWSKKNAKTLYAIQNSCGREMFSFIREIETAKSAWEALEQECRVLQGYDENNAEHFRRYVSFTNYVFDGDWEKARECIGEIDVRSVARTIDTREDDYGDIAIHVAARKGHLNIVKKLVQLMTLEDLKMKNGDGDTALHIAVEEGNVQIVKELGPAMGEVKDGNGDTALHITVKEGNVQIVKELVQLMRQGDFKIKNDDGETALHIAVKKQQLDIVKELVRLIRQEDLNMKNDDGHTALHLAVNKGNVPIVKELVTKEEGENDIAEADFDRYIPFTSYVTEGDWVKVKNCLGELDDPCDAIRAIDPRKEYKNTALHVAAGEGHVDVIKGLVLLLNVGQEDLELKSAKDFTAFGCSVNLDVSEEVLMEKAKYMVEQYERTLGSILEIQNAKGSTALRLAVLEGNVDIVKELAPHMRPEGLELKSISGSNALHQAVLNGHMHIVKELVPLMRQEAMEEKEGDGYTALGCAIGNGDGDVLEVAKHMAGKNTKVFGIPTPPYGDIPVIWAARSCKWKLARYLYSITPPEVLNGPNGSSFVCYCLKTTKEIDLAWDLLQRYPKLAITLTERSKTSPIWRLARLRDGYLSGVRLTRWERWIYDHIHIREVAHACIHDISINVASSEDDHGIKREFISSDMSLFRRFVKALHKLCGFHRIYEMKSTHKWIFEFLHCTSEAIRDGNLTPDQLDMVKQSIFAAIEQGHFEFVTHICKENPQLLDLCDANDRNIFHFSIECRQQEVYSLIHGLKEEQRNDILTNLVNWDNTLLHYAANLSSLQRFHHIKDASLQMQRELQWFKEVESVVPLEIREFRNRSDDMTARKLFTKNHKKLMEDAENSIKGTATSCTVGGALIVTMMFAVAFTVPGGNDGSTGLPLFLDRKLFKLFVVSDAISLVSSTTSVITFLGILTSRYAEDDFLKSLPTKMMIGLVTLFVAITTMMIVFFCALVIMLDGNAWIVSLSIFLATVPVISFIWLLFPLLIEILTSTYGPGIFDKKIRP